MINIRKVYISDLERIAEIEAACFPVEEAASKEAFRERIAAFSECFFAAEEDGKMIGFIDGCATDSDTIYDEMYHDVSNHVPDGDNLAVFGLDVIPEYRRRGIAAKLMNYYIDTARKQGRKKIILTCKDRLIHYYETFGYVNKGISKSTHGGAEWFDMVLTLA